MIQSFGTESQRPGCNMSLGVSESGGQRRGPGALHPCVSRALKFLGTLAENSALKNSSLGNNHREYSL